MTATGNEAVSLEQLLDFSESTLQVFIVTGGTSSKTVEMNGWEVNVPAGNGGTYVFLTSKNFIVLHAMCYTAKPSGNMNIGHSIVTNRLRSSATAYSTPLGDTTRGWPISGTPNRYTGSSQITSDVLEVVQTISQTVTIRIADANNSAGYQLNANFNVNFCVWVV